MKLTNRAYDTLKFIALVLLPGFSAAYFGLAQIWGLPHAEQIVGTATVIDTLLGLLLKASSSNHDSADEGMPTSAGDLIVTHSDGEKYLSMALENDPETLMDQQCVSFKVVHRNHRPESLADVDKE